MPALTDALADLLIRYDDAKAAGRPATPQQLCRDTPDLIGPFTQLLKRLGRVDPVFDGAALASQSNAVEVIDAGRFDPLSFHDEGGLGVVYLAEDAELRRPVALKWMKPLPGLDPAARRRFVLEAEITGKLEHPGIAPVYGAGHDPHGRPYYAMRFIHGVTFGNAIERYHALPETDPNRPVEFTRLLRAFVSVCQTVAYAHARGVIHRDLKPGNVMLGPYGETLVVDWGLAKRYDRADADETADAGYGPVELKLAGGEGGTVYGQVKGSPAYMAPEQARGEVDRVGPASDVYALGATLYALLAGRAPYSGPTAAAVVDQVKRGAPSPPRKVASGVPRPLDAICGKAMARNEGDRYGTPLELAADIERWLADEPLTAYRDPLLTRGRRWVKRHRTGVATLLAALLVVGLALAVVTPLLAAKNRELNDQNEKITGQSAQLTEQNRVIFEKVELAEAEVKLRKQKAEELAATLYNTSIARANLEWTSNNVRTAEQVLDGLDPERRGWEWRYLKRRCHPELRTLRDSMGCNGVAMSRDGRLLASSNFTFGHVELRFKIDGGDYLTFPGTFSLRDKNDFLSMDVISSVAIAPDRRWVAAQKNDVVKVWNVSDRKELASWSGTIDGIAVSPDGKILALGERKRIRLIDTRTWKESSQFAVEAGLTSHLTFDPQGARLAATDLVSQCVRVWDVATGKETFTAHTLWYPPRCVAFAPDGKRLACGVGNTVELYDLTVKPLPGQDPRPARTFVGHTNQVLSVAFHPTAPLLVSGGIDKTIRLWRLDRSEPLSTFRGHSESVNTLAFTTDGKELLSAGLDAVKFWDPLADQEGVVREGVQAAMSADGKYVATTVLGRARPTSNGTKAVWLWDARTGKLVREFGPHEGDVSCLALSRDGKFLASGWGMFGGSVTVWETETGKSVRTFDGGKDGFRKLAYSPDGSVLVAATDPLSFDFKKRPPIQLVFFDPATGKKLREATCPPGDVTGLEFSPDGKTLVAAGGWGVQLFDAATGEWQSKLPDAGSSAAFSPDGRYLLTTGAEIGRDLGRITVWDWAARKELYRLQGHTKRVNAATMNGDGSRLFSVGDDGLVLVWDTAARQEILRLTHGDGEPRVHTVLADPRGEYLVTASGGGIYPGFTRIWPAPVAK